MSKENTTPRDRRGKELKPIMSHAKTQANGRVILFELVVAHRCVLIVRDVNGEYHHTLTTDFDRCGQRTRDLSIKAAIAEAKAYYDEKKFIYGKEDTYGELTRTVKRYVVVMANGSDPEVSGPFKTEDEQDSEARRLRGEDEEGDVVLWANVGPGGTLDMQAYSRGFFEGFGDDEAEEEAA